MGLFIEIPILAVKRSERQNLGMPFLRFGWLLAVACVLVHGGGGVAKGVLSFYCV